MRTTKVLLLTAAIGAAGVVSSMAQVYSVNVVGFVNLSLPAGYSLISAPLKGTNDTIGAVLPVVPDGTTLTKWKPDTQHFDNQLTYDSGIFNGWDNPAAPINPGEAFFINVGPAAATITLVGEVRQGSLATPLVAGYNFVASQVPQQGLVSGALGLAPADGDTAITWNKGTQHYNNQATFDSGIFGGWDAEPTLEIGEGIILSRAAAGSWTRTFNVGP